MLICKEVLIRCTEGILSSMTSGELSPCNTVKKTIHILYITEVGSQNSLSKCSVSIKDREIIKKKVGETRCKTDLTYISCLSTINKKQ